MNEDIQQPPVDTACSTCARGATPGSILLLIAGKGSHHTTLAEHANQLDTGGRGPAHLGIPAGTGSVEESQRLWQQQQQQQMWRRHQHQMRASQRTQIAAHLQAQRQAHQHAAAHQQGQPVAPTPAPACPLLARTSQHSCTNIVGPLAAYLTPRLPNSQPATRSKFTKGATAETTARSTPASDSTPQPAARSTPAMRALRQAAPQQTCWSSRDAPKCPWLSTPSNLRIIVRGRRCVRIQSNGTARITFTLSTDEPCSTNGRHKFHESPA